jgi:hypothetical protein
VHRRLALFLTPGERLGSKTSTDNRPVGSELEECRDSLGLRMEFHKEIDEGVSEFLGCDRRSPRVDRVIFRLKDFSVSLHESIGHCLFAREKAVERTYACIAPRRDLRHGCCLISPFLNHGRRRLHQIRDTLTADIPLRFRDRRFGLPGAMASTTTVSKPSEAA